MGGVSRRRQEIRTRPFGGMNRDFQEASPTARIGGFVGHTVGWNADPSVDNMLKITGDGRKAALDMRLVNPVEEPDGETTLMLAVQRIKNVRVRDGGLFRCL